MKMTNSNMLPELLILQIKILFFLQNLDKSDVVFIIITVALKPLLYMYQQKNDLI